MKYKTLSIFISMLMLLNVICFTVYAKEPTVIINGQELQSDVSPQIINDRTMVPMRAIFEALGYSVNWNEQTQKITATGNDKIIINVGSNIFYKNDVAYTSDVAPVIINDRVLLPLRAIGEALGYEVIWDGNNMIVYINVQNSNCVLTCEQAIYNVKQFIVSQYGDTYGAGANDLLYKCFDKGDYYLVNAGTWSPELARKYGQGTYKYRVYKADGKIVYIGVGSSWASEDAEYFI